MTAVCRLAHPRPPRFVAGLVGVLILTAVAAAAQPRGESARDGSKRGARQETAATTRRVDSAESQRSAADEAARADDEVPETAAPAPAPVPKSQFEVQPIRRTQGPKVGGSATTQKSTARSSSNGFEAARVATALGAVLVLILLLRWFGRRLFGGAGAGRSTRTVQVMSRSPLSPRQQLVLIRVGRRLLVVADGGGQMNTLSEITDPDEVAGLLGQLQDDHAGRMTTTFGNLFGKMRGPFEGGAAGEAAAAATDDDAADGADPGSRDTAGPRRAGLLGGRGVIDEPAVESTRQELSGLMDKVRMLSRQFKAP